MRKKKKEKEAPLSYWAESKMRDNYFHYFGFTTIVSAILGFLWILACMILFFDQREVDWTFKEFLFWIMVFIVSSFLAFLVNYILVGQRYKRKKTEIFAKNEKDYQQSLRLKSVLDNFCSVVVSDFPVLEQEVAGSWKPFRVEHFLSDSIKSQIIAQTELKLFPFRSSVRGVSYSIATPNLVDSSSVLFLKNNEGKTLRALIPSPRATKEMIIGAMKKWFSDVPKCSCIPGYTHIRGVLEKCSFSEENVGLPISHPQLVDLLDSSCELDFGKRPSVSVIGQEIQEGVVIATALEVDGRRKIFLPTGFFEKLADGVSSAVQNALPAPTALEAVRTV